MGKKDKMESKIEDEEIPNKKLNYEQFLLIWSCKEQAHNIPYTNHMHEIEITKLPSLKKDINPYWKVYPKVLCGFIDFTLKMIKI